MRLDEAATLLQVDTSAPEEEVRRAFRKAALRYHPVRLFQNDERGGCMSFPSCAVPVVAAPCTHTPIGPKAWRHAVSTVLI